MKSLRDMNDRLEISHRALEFGHLARAMLVSGGDALAASKVEGVPLTVQSMLVGHARHDIFKTAVSAGSTSDATFAEPLSQYQAATAGFLASLRSSGVGALLPFTRKVP